MDRALSPRWRQQSQPLWFEPRLEEAEEQNLFVSSTVMRDGCDLIWAEKAADPPDRLFGELPEGTVVFVNVVHLRRFIADILPRLRAPIVLVCGCDTRSPAVEGYQQLYTHPMLLHAFIQNCDFAVGENPGVSTLPLGLNFHKLDPGSNNQSSDMGQPCRPGNQQLTLKAIRDTIGPLEERPLKVYANFHLNMDTFLRHPQARVRRRARLEALKKLRRAKWVEFERRQTPRNVVWQRYRDFAFEASPRGNGWDCHRTYEALLLKTIPILKRSPIDAVYDGLPVAFVDDWSEVTQERMAEWVEEFAPALNGPIPDKLYSNHWLERFRQWQS